MQTPDVAFRERLNMVVNQHGYTVVKAAEVCGVAKTTMWNWISGGNMPNAYQLAYLCYGLGVSADWIIGLSEEVERR